MNPKERFISACRSEPVDRPPIWMMRQAGRYLPEYRAIKQLHPTKQMMQTPEIACEITLQPVRLIGVDAAILYSDILMIPDALGMKLDFASGEGPEFAFAIQNANQLAKLDTKNVLSRLSYVFEAAQLCVQKLPDDFPLLGFAGAPFTVACYMIAGRAEKNFTSVMNLMEHDPKTFHALMQLLSDITLDYLIRQADAGAVAVQLFDTWAGLLDLEQYKIFAKPYTQKILAGLKQNGIPSIHFIKNGAGFFSDMLDLKSDVIGIDWTLSLKTAFEKAKGQSALQGNFNPDWLKEDFKSIKTKLQSMLDDVPDLKKGYIVNLGHGIDKTTPVENVRFFVEQAKNRFA